MTGYVKPTQEDLDELMRMLREPFPETEIEWRVGSVSKKGDKVMPLAYLTARAVMDRLDEVFGPMGWNSEMVSIATKKEDGICCRLSVRFKGLYREVEDVCPASDIESLKGSASGALKRAAVHLGIGRYLYYLDAEWVPLHDTRPRGPSNFHNGKFWQPPKLKPEFLPGGVTAKAPHSPISHREVEAVKSHLRSSGFDYIRDKLIVDMLLNKHFGIADARSIALIDRSSFDKNLSAFADECEARSRKHSKEQA